MERETHGIWRNLSGFCHVEKCKSFFCWCLLLSVSVDIYGLHFCVWCILFCCVPRLKAVFTGVGGFFLCSETTTSISVVDIFDLALDKQDKGHCFNVQPLIVFFITFVLLVIVQVLLHVILLKASLCLPTLYSLMICYWEVVPYCWKENIYSAHF